MKMNPQINRLVEFLKMNPGRHSSKTLIEVLGIQGANEQLCHRILDGFASSDKRLLFTPGEGWALRSISNGKTSSENNYTGPFAIDTHTRTETVTAISVQFSPASRGGPHLPFQIAARILSDTPQAGEENDFGPFIVVTEEIDENSYSDDSRMLTVSEFVSRFKMFAADRAILAWHPIPVRDIISHSFQAVGREAYGPPLRSLSELAGFLFPDRKTANFQQFLLEQDWSGPEPVSARFELDALVDSWFILIDELQELFGLSYSAWQGSLMSASVPSAVCHGEINSEFLQCLPEQPGVYIMEDRSGNPLYIGKSKCIKTRVGGYFRVKPSMSSKLERIFAHLHRINVEVTGSELSAEILEAVLISHYKPPFNTVMDMHADEDPHEGGFFLILPAVRVGERELHFVRDSCSDYFRLLVSHDTTDVDTVVDHIELFFHGGPLPSSILTGEKLAPLIRHYGRICTPRWWRRNRDCIPRYDHAHLTKLDMKALMSAILDDTFSPEHRYST